MALQTTISLVPFQTQPPLWGELSPLTRAFEAANGEFVTTTPVWAELSTNVLPASALTADFKPTTPLWGEISEISLPEFLTTSQDQSSDPYIQDSEVDPPNGSINIPITQVLTIPCGDRIPETGDSLFDPLLGSVSSPVLVGVNPTKTTISFGYNDGAKIVIYENGSAISGWDVNKVANNYSGSERDVLAGWTYEIESLLGFPYGVTVQFEIYLEDYSGSNLTYQYSFGTQQSPTRYMNVEGVFIVSQDVLKIVFGSSVAITKSFSNPNSYKILDTDGNVVASVMSILPVHEGTKVTNQLWVQVTGLIPGLRYVFSIPEGILFDQEGHPFAAMTCSWLMNKTKIDGVLVSLSNMYNTRERGTFRGILEAIMLSDEEIGGDF
jgi:hypothetical protein